MSVLENSMSKVELYVERFGKIYESFGEGYEGFGIAMRDLE